MSGRDELRAARAARKGRAAFTTRGVDLSNVRPVTFTWKPWIVAGALNLVVGEEGVGKSTLQAHIAAGVTTGVLPGSLAETPADVLFIGAEEDDWHEITVPRLIAARADLNRVQQLHAVGDEPFNVEDHAGHLGRILHERPYGLVVIEQLMDVLPAMRSYTDPAAIRRVTWPTRRALREHGVAGLGTLHVNKADPSSFRQAQQGSMQFGALSRSSFLVARHPSDPLRRVAVLGKSNYTRDGQAALSFVLADQTISPNGHTFNIGKADDFRDESITMSDVLGGDRKETPRDRAVEFLRDLLADGPRRAGDVYDQAKDEGISRRTLERAKQNLDVDSFKKGLEWWWLLSEDDE